MNTSLRIIGAGGHGKVAADTATAMGYDDIAFLDDTFPTRQKNGRWPIIDTVVAGTGTKQPLFCAIGCNAVRAEFFDQYALSDSPTLIHPSAILSPSVRCGAGGLIVAGAIVNADTRIGKGVILNTGCSVDHDCTLGDFTHISPGARLAGGVTIGAHSWVGIGAVVREGIRIGHNVLIAAGAVVVTDIPNGTRVGGVPAKPI